MNQPTRNQESHKLRPVLVTGANGGIGQILIRELAERGFQVYAGIHSAEGMEKFRTHPGLAITPLRLDVTSATSIAAAAQRIGAESDGLSGLVNLAGLIVEGPLDLVDVDDFRIQFEVNVVGTFAVTRAMLPLLIDAQGRVVNIGAATAHTTVPFYGAVSASKAALASISDAMRMEFGPFGVEVALIEPGALRTPIFDKAAALYDATLSRSKPQRAALYRPAMDAVRAALVKSGADDPKVIADAVVKVLTMTGKPKARALVGKGAAQLGLLSWLPDRLRDSMLMSSLGIERALKSSIDAARIGRMAEAGTPRFDRSKQA